LQRRPQKIGKKNKGGIFNEKNGRQQIFRSIQKKGFALINNKYFFKRNKIINRLRTTLTLRKNNLKKFERKKFVCFL
jgi:hypothetical protein